MVPREPTAPPLWFDRERCACGIGLVADPGGSQRHRVLGLALEALGRLAHRAALGADGVTADGTGVLTQIPWTLLRRELAGTAPGLDLPASEEDLALGCFFLPQGSAAATETTLAEMARELAVSGLAVLAWRQVPTEPAVLGPLGRETCPGVFQAVLARPSGVVAGDPFERRLYLARRRLEKALSAAEGEPPVVVSFSHRTVIYKAMTPPAGLADFYPDLRGADYQTAVALFHQRFSTNTRPSWRLAQPFRLLAHNGEINTLQGNFNWMRAREPDLASEVWGSDLADLLPVLDPAGSDSAMLDQMLELLVRSGRDLPHALAMLIPEASRQDSEKADALRAFYDYHATLLEPWDGPAAVVATDGRRVVAALDRNGLRPLRTWITASGLVVAASEAGVVTLPDEDVVAKGRLGPGQRLALDLERGTLEDDTAVKSALAGRRPWRSWLSRHRVVPPADLERVPPREIEPERRRALELAFGYSREALERILEPMAQGRLPVGSMGNDTPLAVLSEQPQLLYRYFKQRFAQVTNPPIDPLRERLTFSLETLVGGGGNLLEEVPAAAHRVRFDSPVVGSAQLEWLVELGGRDPAFLSHRLDATFSAEAGAAGLAEAVSRLQSEAEAATDGGFTVLVLSDRAASPQRVPVPMLLATAAVHSHLVRARRRMRVSLVCDTGEPREDHHVACLLGFGATLVHPYLAYAAVREQAPRLGLAPEEAVAGYRRTLDDGLLKVLSKLGVGPLASYHGAQLFEIVGLSDSLVAEHFPGTPSRVGGVGLERLAADALALHRDAFALQALPDRGLFRFRRGGEHHELRPEVFTALHEAVRGGRPEAFARFSSALDQGPPRRLRDLLTWRKAERPLAVDEVEGAGELMMRFSTAAMSLGAVSREAHEALAVAMNRLGARSCSGEGGEEAERFEPYQAGAEPRLFGAWQPRAGDWAASAIRQVASGRFGVTPHYLVTARELEIKIAQGSKPGEGGQIPGAKVTVEIARLRRAIAGRTLISPPPHHDIYSIEDLAQLIYDLRRVNPRARVGVKLVSLSGVGTIACGVAKAGADYVHVAGDDGGTGASPLSSIKHAGLPWELGLAEAQRCLVEAGLRQRVTLRVDGGLKTGRDVVVAGLLGADEMAFGTAPLVALGCVMARQCHNNTCPVGVASQREELRRKFTGAPEHVVAFFGFVAQEVREALAELGLHRFDELVGQSELLRVRDGGPPGLDLSELLRRPAPPRRRGDPEAPVPRPATLDDRLWRDAAPRLNDQQPILLDYPISNGDRSVGARLSGEIALETRGAGLPAGRVQATFRGVAGQSFGAFLSAGMELRLVGEAQDGVGKGLGGGRLVLAFPPGARYAAGAPVIAGNALLYGATGGELFAAGRVGERFCVRNSGALAVVEGCGDHGCEYMTGGLAAVLGPIGRNFGAGMSGGLAYLWDPEGLAAGRVNPELVRLSRLSAGDRGALRRLLEAHLEATGSDRARSLLESWFRAAGSFVSVTPREGAVKPSSFGDDLAASAPSPLAGVRGSA